MKLSATARILGRLAVAGLLAWPLGAVGSAIVVAAWAVTDAAARAAAKAAADRKAHAQRPERP